MYDHSGQSLPDLILLYTSRLSLAFDPSLVEDLARSQASDQHAETICCFGCVSFLADQLVHSAHPIVAQPLELRANARKAAGAQSGDRGAATGQSAKSSTGAGLSVFR